MPSHVLLFDLDDTLYPPSTRIWDLIGDRIDLFIETRLHIEPEKIPPLRKRLFTNFGTTLLGLVIEFNVDRDDYLSFVHNVPVEELLIPDETLRSLLLAAPYKKIIFTNADRRYAKRVIHALGLDECFSQIIDILDIWPNCKPQKEAFHKAIALTDEIEPGNLILFDDTPANVDTASRLGIYSILVGNKPTNGIFDRRISSIHAFPNSLPDGNI